MLPSERIRRPKRRKNGNGYDFDKQDIYWIRSKFNCQCYQCGRFIQGKNSDTDGDKILFMSAAYNFKKGIYCEYCGHEILKNRKARIELNKL